MVVAGRQKRCSKRFGFDKNVDIGKSPITLFGAFPGKHAKTHEKHTCPAALVHCIATSGSGGCGGKTSFKNETKGDLPDVAQANRQKGIEGVLSTCPVANKKP